MLLAPFYLRRALGIWVACRLAAAMMSGLAGGDPFRLPALAAFLVILVCVGLCLVDVARNRERALLGNFGVSRAHVVALSVVTAIVGEVAVVAALAGGAR